MTNDKRRLLDLLNHELTYVESGGYRKTAKQPWRMPLIFEDSPSCINYLHAEHPTPCEECPLIQLVPSKMREQRFPCRHIPLTASGDTLDSLYRWANSHEIEQIVTEWLRAQISKLESEITDIEKTPETTAITPHATH